MEKKIKIVVFGMVVALLVTFLPFRQTDIYAEYQKMHTVIIRSMEIMYAFSRSRKPMG